MLPSPIAAIRTALSSGENTMSLQEKFIELWDSTIPEHKALSKWAGNPWVWVIEFEEVQF